MGFFAVVREQDQQFEVKACHLNLWSLAGLFRRAFFWDVAIHVKATSNEPLRKLSLALPFSTETGGMRDLSGLMKSQEVSELIFGTSVSISDAEIRYTKEGGSVSLILAQVSETVSDRDKRRSGSTFSYWTLTFAEPIHPNEERYMRVRFEVYNLGRTWIWKPFKSGAIIDLRVADLRETVSIKQWNDLKSRIVPIEDLYLFVVAPSWLQHVSSSPQLRYMRVLEGRVWENYLRRKTDLFRLEKMVIYYWRRGKLEDVPLANTSTTDTSTPLANTLKTDTVTPFRAFLDVNKTNGFSVFGNLVLTAVAAFLAVLIANVLGSHPKDLAAGYAFVSLYVKAHFFPVSIVGLVAFVKLMNDKYRFYSGVFPKVIKIFYRIEQVLYGIWQRP